MRVWKLAVCAAITGLIAYATGEVLTTAGTLTKSAFLRAEPAAAPSRWPEVIVAALILVCSLLAFVIERHAVIWLPESVGFLTVGIVIGVLLRLSVETQQLTVFDPNIFFLVLLPPIILDNGYSMRKARELSYTCFVSNTTQKHFFENLGPICLYAIVGTILSSLTVGLGLLYLGVAGLSFPFTVAAALSFGALISATDPVATLAVFAHVGAPETLHSMLGGERYSFTERRSSRFAQRPLSLLNDAIAIVLYRYGKSLFICALFISLVQNF